MLKTLSLCHSPPIFWSNDWANFDKVLYVSITDKFIQLFGKLLVRPHIFSVPITGSWFVKCMVFKNCKSFFVIFWKNFKQLFLVHMNVLLKKPNLEKVNLLCFQNWVNSEKRLSWAHINFKHTFLWGKTLKNE